MYNNYSNPYFTFLFDSLVEVNGQDPKIFYTNDQIKLIELNKKRNKCKS